jgi:hypothetical protein
MAVPKCRPRGASIAAGTLLDDAVEYGRWRVARRPVERGAQVGRCWHAAALGITSLIEGHFSGPAKPTSADVIIASWQACHDGQCQAAEYLLQRGANLNRLAPWPKE